MSSLITVMSLTQSLKKAQPHRAAPQQHYAFNGFSISVGLNQGQISTSAQEVQL